MDAGTTAGAVLASTVRVGVRARVNGKGRSSTFSRGGAAICTNGAARNCALPRLGRRWQFGTPEYCGPEVFEGKSGYRTDVYALGVTLFELL